jgi:uncharacterized protein (TIGR03435 family)
VERLIQQAYGVFANGHANRLSSVTVTGGPAWTRSDFYEIEAKAAGRQSQATMNGPMLEALLEDRFKLKIHRETGEVPVYRVTRSSGANQGATPLQPFQGTCVPWDFDNPPGHPAPPSRQCGTGHLTSNGLALDAATMTDLCYFFLVTLDRPIFDETGMTGRFNFHLELPSADLEFFRRAHGSPARRDPATPPTDPAVISAIQSAVQKLGLNLEPSRGPGEFVAIDRVERPSGS